MSNLISAIKGVGVGLGLMYFLDPDRGRRRRALVRDQIVSVQTDLGYAADTIQHDVRNRLRGVLAEGMALVSGGGVSDQVLEERVRANIGRVARNARAIHVTANQGHITLSGPILARDAPRVLLQAATTRGVNRIDDQLEIHETADNIPALQGSEEPMEPTFELMQENWSPTTRLITGIIAGNLATRGIRRGGLLGMILLLAGVALSLRTLTNMELARLLGMGGRHRGIDVQKVINVNAPVAQVYDFWSKFENFPRFMAHIQEVKNLGNGRYHWVVSGPAGVPVEWDAIMTDQIENEQIAWQSEEGEIIDSSGVVQFHENQDGTTRITVRMNYNPPAGALGHTVAAIFGVDPKRAMDKDLMRFKSLIEHGKTTAGGKEVKRDEVTGTVRATHTY